MFPSDPSSIIETDVTDAQFADDTTLYSEIIEILLGEGGEQPSIPVELTEYLRTIHDSGMRENEGKRLVDDITQIDATNLGVQTRTKGQISRNVGKMWGAYRGIVRKVAGEELSRKEKN